MNFLLIDFLLYRKKFILGRSKISSIGDINLEYPIVVPPSDIPVVLKPIVTKCIPKSILCISAGKFLFNSIFIKTLLNKKFKIST
ncbi:hypothetical protein GW796_00665 [archaeon]|nr:hypothetical protein [archaeon]